MTFLIKILLVLVVVFLFGLVVFVHELGHFLAARWLGFRVTAFAIGMGPALWKRKIGHTEYRINALPIGGYCMLPQMDPSGMEKLQGADEGKKEEASPDIAPWKRIVVSLAGPAGNIALALLAAWLIYAFAPAAATGALDTRIGFVDDESAAFQAGVRENQTLLQVGSRPVRTWNDFMQEAHLAGNAGELIPLTLAQPDGETLTAQVPLAVEEESLRFIEGFRFVEGVEPFNPTFIAEVFADTPAERAGVMVGDIVLAVNGQKVGDNRGFIRAVARNGEEPLTLDVSRGGEKVSFVVAPVFNPEAGRAQIGVMLGLVATQPAPWMVHREPVKQVMWDAGSVHRALGGLVAPKVPGETKRVAQSLGGPVRILQMFWLAAGAGVWICLGFVRLICINLAIINLLPFPVLDGGHILFALWEIITRRKPNAKVVEVLVTVFAFLLIGAMVLLTFKDSWELGVKKLVSKKPAVVEQVQE